jgi:hypothetical protein
MCGNMLPTDSPCVICNEQTTRTVQLENQQPVGPDVDILVPRVWHEAICSDQCMDQFFHEAICDNDAPTAVVLQ